MVRWSVGWVVVGRIHATAASVFDVGVCSALGTAIGFFAADAGADCKPKARLSDVTDFGVILTSAGHITMRLPVRILGSFSTDPPWEEAIDRVPGLGINQITTSCR